VITHKHLEAIQLALEFIENNLTHPISVQDVCSTNPMSPWQFQRLFRLYTTDSIGRYLRTRRLTKAAVDLMQNPNSRILDVAIEYQFGSQEAFTRAFKKMFEVTPGEIAAFQGHMRLKQKLKLTNEQLLHNLVGIQREPSLVQFPARCLMGIEIQIPSPLTEDLGYVQQVSNLWLNFNPRRKEILNRKQGIGYGLITSLSQDMIDDTLSYMASVEINPNENPPAPLEMKRVDLGPQLYATFEKRGLADKTRMSLDYIYGFWLPQSGFERTQGYDLEIFDSRLRLDQPDSLSIYCIPVVAL